MAATSAESDAEVRGPVAMMTGPSTERGIRSTSSRTRVMRGCVEMACDLGGETIAVDRERRARRHARCVRGAHHQRPKPAHLLFQEADRVVEFVAAERIAADQFREPIGLVNGRRTHRPHFMNRDRHTESRRLPRGLTACQATADNVNHEGYRAQAFYAGASSSVRT